MKVSIFAIIDDILNSTEKNTITIKQLNEKLENITGFALLFILALPCCLPFLYVIPQLVSLPIILIFLQLIFNKGQIWLPKKIEERELPINELKKTNKMAKKYLGWMEFITHPRLEFIFHPKVALVSYILMIIPSISILVPLPLTNTVPGFAVTLFAFASIMKDGLLKILAILIGNLWVLLLIFMAFGLVDFLLAYFNK